MEQDTQGSLLPSGALVPPQPALSLSSDPGHYSMNAWGQCLAKHDQVLRAVNGEQKLRKEWYEQLQGQFIAQAEKHSEQIVAICERHASQQEDLLNRVSEQLIERVIAEICQAHQNVANTNVINHAPLQVFPTPGIQSIGVGSHAGNRSVNLSLEVATMGRSQSSLAKSEAMELDKSEAMGCRREGYYGKDSLEDYILNGPGPSEHSLAGGQVDWYEHVIRKGNSWIDAMHPALYRLGLTHSPKLAPPPTLLAKIVHAESFKIASAMLILVNTICIGIEAHISVTYVLASPREQEQPGFFSIVDAVFIGIFVFELLLRMYAERFWFFLGPERGWNMFDFLLIVSSVFSKFLDRQTLFNVRAFRTFRSVRVLRIIRVLHFFRELRLMVLAIGSALWSLAWAFTLLLLIMFAFAITILQNVYYHVKDIPLEDVNPDLILWWGGMPSAMFSLMQAISGGYDWGDLVEPLGNISYFWKVSFSVYIVFIVFGVLNVLTGVFVTTASEIMDTDLIAHTESHRDKSIVKDMQALFVELRIKNQKKISWEDFKRCMKSGKMLSYLSAVGIDRSDAFSLFRLLDPDDTRSIDIMQFIIGCVRVRGQATRMNLLVLNRDLERYDLSMHEMRISIEAIRADLSVMLRACGAVHMV